MSKLDFKSHIDLEVELGNTEESLYDRDICFSDAYARAFEVMENGKAEQFLYSSNYGTVSHTFIKRLIPFEIDGKRHYDITTPYGFGGPVIIDSSNKERLLKDYFKAFHNYCKRNNIVSEFTRFHLFENQDVRKEFYGETILCNSVISRNLSKPINQDIEPRLLKDVKKAEDFGLTIDFDYTGSSQSEFLKIYTETMNRKHASDFYYIDEKFLTRIQRYLEGRFMYANARLDGEVVASRLVIFNYRYGYYFLGGNSKEYYKYKNGTFLDYKLLIELKEKGVQHYIFGGGYQGKDGIYRYKKKFDKSGDVPFYIGKKIHMAKEYDYLTFLRKEKENYDKGTTYFPLYRAPRT